ncbi:MAG: SurA N-terminal domain-containing protein [Gammaproteobacteria bacterium]|nr:SurA N-terminal domain-containing protein [Gammaproteobacteria bacterium]
MLQAINDRIKGWLGVVIVAIIGLPFALWGIQSYLDDSGPQYAAKVNDKEISAHEFERAVSMQRQSMMRKFGGKLPVEEKVLREQTLTQLINQRLLEGVTFDNGYRISDMVLSETIRQQFTVDGVFDRDRFEASVASIGMSIPMYEHSLRSELRVQQMQSAIANSSFVTENQVSRLAALNDQTRDISVLKFDVEHFSTADDPTEAEVKQYYDDNIERFMEPEKIKVDYVEITSQSLADNIKVDEARIKSMYDDYVSSISSHEQRKASHILIQTTKDDAASREAAKAKIESIKKEIDNGADFAELAKKYSDDKGSADEGGDLGWVSSGDMAKPFEQALFAMKPSDNGKPSVSDIVETQFGYHLIKLDDIRSEAIEPLEVKRAGFEDELKADRISSMFYDLSERLASLTYENPDSLEVAVEQLGLKIHTTDYFTRSSGKGIAGNAKVRNSAFSPLVLEQGSNSDMIEISPTHVVVLRMNEHVPAKPIPLDVVSSKVKKILSNEKGHEQTKTAALDVKARIEAGETIDSLKADGITINVITSLGRNDFSKVSDPSILQNAFEMSPNQDAKPVVKEVDLASGDVALVVLNKVNTPENIARDKLDLVKNETIRENAIRDFSSTLLYIKNHADIDKNKRILEK